MSPQAPGRWRVSDGSEPAEVVVGRVGENKELLVEYGELLSGAHEPVVDVAERTIDDGTAHPPIVRPGAPAAPPGPDRSSVPEGTGLGRGGSSSRTGTAEPVA